MPYWADPESLPVSLTGCSYSCLQQSESSHSTKEKKDVQAVLKNKGSRKQTRQKGGGRKARKGGSFTLIISIIWFCCSRFVRILCCISSYFRNCSWYSASWGGGVPSKMDAMSSCEKGCTPVKKSSSSCTMTQDLVLTYATRDFNSFSSDFRSAMHESNRPRLRIIVYCF